MFPKSKITEIYYMADDFCKEFAWWQEKYMVKDSNRKHCNKQNRMSDIEIITILILFHPGDFRCFSPYYKGDACKRLKQLFSCLVCKHSVNHVFSSPTSIINFTSKKPSYDDTRRSGRDNELLQRAQNDL